MNKLFIIALFCASHSAMSEELPDTLYPAYSLGNERKDSKLDHQHAIFELTFRVANRFLTDPENTWPKQVQLSCNGVISNFVVESNNPTTELIVSPGKYVFQVYMYGNYSEIFTDSVEISGQSRKEVIFNFTRTYTEEMDLKPVIYTYAPTPIATTISILPKGHFTFTYPEILEGKWTGAAQPDGSFTSNGKTYPYLFWEGEGRPVITPTFEKGYVVKQENVLAFLEEKLSLMGMNTRESTDFITFWGPKMQQSEQGFAHFLFNEEYDAVARMTVNPTPDHIYRVYMLWTPIEDAIGIFPEPQTIPVIRREGFYLLEWGGSIISHEHQLSDR